MDCTVSVIIATYGDDHWRDLAQSRALPSVELTLDERGGQEVICEHGPNLRYARNMGATRARGEWLCFLDADDELSPGYLDALLALDGDLRAPMLQFVYPDGREDAPMSLVERNIDHLNPCVIGTLVRREMFLDVGGFAEWPMYEDWELWLRCVRSGATIAHCDKAIYRQHLRPGSRNQQPRALALKTYREIRKLHAA